MHLLDYNVLQNALMIAHVSHRDVFTSERQIFLGCLHIYVYRMFPYYMSNRGL